MSGECASRIYMGVIFHVNFMSSVRFQPNNITSVIF